MVKFGDALKSTADEFAEAIGPEKYMAYEKLKKALYDEPQNFLQMWEEELFRIRDFIVESSPSDDELWSCTAGQNIMCVCAVKRRANRPTRVLDALSRFVQMNREGFRKIVKKYDKVNGKQESLPRGRMAAAVLSDPIEELETLLSVGVSSRRMEDDDAELHPLAKLLPPWARTKLAVAAVCLLACVAFGLVLSFGVRASKIFNVFLVGLVASFVLAVANGANDIANSVGTSVGSGALTLRQAIIWGCFFEFLGAVTIGPHVAKSIGDGLIEPEEYDKSADIFALAMLSVLIGAASTTLLATAYGFPISATHSVIGGLVAVGIAAKGVDSIGWMHLAFTCFGWVLSPVAGGVVSGLIYALVLKSVIHTSDPVARSMQMQPRFTAMTVAICLLFMLKKGPPPIKMDDFPLAIGVAIVGGIAFSACVEGIKHVRGNHSQIANDANPAEASKDVSKDVEVGNALEDAVAVDRQSPASLSAPSEAGSGGEGAGWGGGDAQKEDATTAAAASGGGGADGGEANIVRTLEPRESWEPPSGLAGADDLEAVDQEQARAERAERPFVVLLVASAMTVAFAHGGNDVGNAVGPLAVILGVYRTEKIAMPPHIPFWALCIGAVGFCVGIVLLGSRTISTVGSKITKLTPSKSYATQMGAAVAVLSASALGLPVSTSHCLVGAVIGIGVVQKYMTPEATPLSLSVLKKIVLGWAATIPLAMFVSVVIFVPLRSTFD